MQRGGFVCREKEKEKSMPLGVMTGASVPRSSPRDLSVYRGLTQFMESVECLHACNVECANLQWLLLFWMLQASREVCRADAECKRLTQQTRCKTLETLATTGSTAADSSRGVFG